MKPCLDGIYFLIKDRQCVYVGQSNDIYRRISEHRRGTSTHGFSNKDFDSWDYIETSSQCEKDRLEYLLIHMIRPKYNIDYRLTPNAVPMREKLKQIEECVVSAKDTIKFVERIERLEERLNRHEDADLVEKIIFGKVG